MHLNKGYVGKKHHFLTKVNHHSLHLPPFKKSEGHFSFFWYFNLESKPLYDVKYQASGRSDVANFLQLILQAS
jgi:hypothetical protein